MCRLQIRLRHTERACYVGYIISCRSPYRLHLSGLPASDDGLGVVASAAVRHRFDLVERRAAGRALLPLSPVLQSGELGTGRGVEGAGHAGDPG